MFINHCTRCSKEGFLSALSPYLFTNPLLSRPFHTLNTGLPTAVFKAVSSYKALFNIFNSAYYEY